jgi:hypothetical protein
LINYDGEYYWGDAMIKLLAGQAESDRAFRRWTDIIVRGSTEKAYGWVIEGRGVVFTNYGHGDPGTIEDQVMLGADLESGNGIVKIVRPETARGGKGKLTVIGRDEKGNLILLRAGQLQKNALSRLIKDDFASLSGLTEIPVSASDTKSPRKWFIVGNLNATPAEIVAQAAQFTLACARARSKASGGEEQSSKKQSYGYGMDEKGRIVKVTRTGGSAEICTLQGYVFEELRKKVGKNLSKPKKNGFSVDCMIEAASLLIEIKTTVFAHDIYEAVGQLRLYPSLIGLPSGLKPILLIPDQPALKPNMATALHEDGIEVYTYSIRSGARKPKITFPDVLLELCKRCPERSCGSPTDMPG